MESIVQDHEQRILQLEQNYSEVRKEIAGVQTSQYRIETTVLKESQEQKQLLNKLIDYHLDTKRFNLDKKWQFLLTAIGSGGLIYFIVEAFMK